MRLVKRLERIGYRLEKHKVDDEFLHMSTYMLFNRNRKLAEFDVFEGRIKFDMVSTLTSKELKLILKLVKKSRRKQT